MTPIRASFWVVKRVRVTATNKTAATITTNSSSHKTELETGMVLSLAIWQPPRGRANGRRLPGFAPAPGHAPIIAASGLFKMPRIHIFYGASCPAGQGSTRQGHAFPARPAATKGTK